MQINVSFIGLFVCLFFVLFLFPSCVYKKISYQVDTRLAGKNLYISWPENPVVFEDFSFYLYKSLWDHFQRVGYKLVSSSHHAYRLRTVIRNIDSIDKLISPDVQPYGFRVIVTIECYLYDQQGTQLATQRFNQYRWIYKPADPLCFRDYIAFQYQKLCDAIPIRIDHFIRPLCTSDRHANTQA